MSHDAVCCFHYRGISGAWLCSVTVWLFSREGVAKSPCKCGSEGGIYMGRIEAENHLQVMDGKPCGLAQIHNIGASPHQIDHGNRRHPKHLLY